MSEIKAVSFDIDGALSEKNSWWELAESLGASIDENLQIYFANKKGELTNKEASRKVFEMWSRRQPVTKENFTKILSEIPLREEVLDLVSYLKQKGLLVCLITGSNEVYAQIVAEKIGADEWYANANLKWNEDGVLENFSYNVDQGSVKVRQLRNFCQKNNLKLEECAVVGDSENDYEIFKLTCRGIAIQSFMEDKIIETIAWKVVKNLSEIKNII